VFKHIYQQVFNLAAFHALPHHPALVRVMKMVVGERLLIHPKPIGRLIFPQCERLTVHAHQDYRFMGGDPECFTVWIPLHDCPIEAGPLQIMEGSHQFGFQKHEDENLHVPEIPDGSAVGGDWVSGGINAGDALMFHSLTVHAASANLSKQFRISIDCRFQDYGRAFNPANLAFAGDSGKSWEKTYAGWPSDDLKYYWKKLPLNLEPSVTELVELSNTASSAALRARYSKILSQLS
jgi:ectoine hydroxylase-related dioxygenase (phytanoyl-CoA dioxygenase family)